MGTVLVESFEPYIRPDVVNAPVALVTQKLISTIIEFCQDSKIWQEEMDAITLIPAVRKIEIPVLPNSTLCDIRRLVYKGKTELVAKSIDEMDRDDPTWRTRNGVGKNYVNINKSVIQLVGHPIDVEPLALTGRIALQPSRTATKVEDFLFNDYVDYIACGTKAKLFAMKDKEWSDEKSALTEMASYETGLEKAKSKAQDNWGSRVKRRSKVYL